MDDLAPDLWKNPAMRRQAMFLVALLVAGTASVVASVVAGVATADTTTDRWGGPNDDRYGSSKSGLPSDRGGGRTCETERGACLISAPKALGSICTCNISGGIVPGYVRW